MEEKLNTNKVGDCVPDFFFVLDVDTVTVFFFQAEDGIRDGRVTGVQTCALPIMSALIAARDEDDRLSEQELTVMCCTLLIGGHETTANQINLSVLLLFAHPGEVAKLRADPGLIPAAVEELLRCTRLGGLAPAR